MLHRRPYELRSGPRGGQATHSARRLPTARSPVREQRRLLNSSMRRLRRRRSTSNSPRRVSIGGEVLVLPAMQGDAYSDITVQIADDQAKKEDMEDPGVAFTVNRGRVREVLVAQAQGRRSYAAATGLRRVVKDALKEAVSGKKGTHLRSALNKIHRKQRDWAEYQDGRVPLRPVPRSTFENYVKQLLDCLEAFDRNNPEATQASREAHGQHWIDTVPLSADWFRFPEFFEYGI